MRRPRDGSSRSGAVPEDPSVELTWSAVGLWGTVATFFGGLHNIRVLRFGHGHCGQAMMTNEWRKHDQTVFCDVFGIKMVNDNIRHAMIQNVLANAMAINCNQRLSRPLISITRIFLNPPRTVNTVSSSRPLWLGYSREKRSDASGLVSQIHHDDERYHCAQISPLFKSQNLPCFPLGVEQEKDLAL